ncbi:hypothetical protein BKA62DRAFT_77180 [Auriculariales sp. MPI-PUGE-AT-0066]|nr:hypothetical protein BKA62DRAFT_77180 [Auriculariales sp. MPI-PUGE-AT-0066]
MERGPKFLKSEEQHSWGSASTTLTGKPPHRSDINSVLSVFHHSSSSPFFFAFMELPRFKLAVVAGTALTFTCCVYLWRSPTIDWASVYPVGTNNSTLLAHATCNSSRNTVALVRVTEDNAQYRLFVPPPPISPDWSRVQPVSSYPAECLDAYVTRGTPCVHPAEPAVQFDFVWTWSNGTERLHRQAYLGYERSTLPIGSHSQADQAVRLKLFREHDELRHSFRSVLQHFRPYLHRIHLVTGDLTPPPGVTEHPVSAGAGDANANAACAYPLLSGEARLGQIPAWLDSSQLDGNISIDVTHHSQYFTQYSDTVFNSLAIESQFPNLPNLHDHFIYMNDDFFFTANLSAADFYTQAYGSVFRMYPSYVIPPSSFRDPSSSPGSAEGIALEWSNELLSRRFGYRARPYPSHESKVVSTPLFRELAATYSDALLDSSRARVRSQKGSKVTNVHMMALYSWFVVERHREAVLWSWAVARMTQIKQKGEEDWVEAAWRELGGVRGTKSLLVHAKTRATLTVKHAKARLEGEERQGMHAYDNYKFSSDDGYPFASLGEKGTKRWPDMRYVDSSGNGHPHFRCKIDRTRCFPTRDDLVAGYTPSDFFQHIAFIDHECGDCVMSALVAASGDLGLSAALPEAENNSDPEAAIFITPPHLPLVDNFFDGNFSVAAVVPDGGDLRAFAVQLIHRYRYVIGRIFSGFAMLNNPSQAKGEFARLNKEIKKGWMNVVCINDDIVDGAPEVDKSFRSWQEERWPIPAKWELF